MNSFSCVIHAVFSQFKLLIKFPLTHGNHITPIEKYDPVVRHLPPHQNAINFKTSPLIAKISTTDTLNVRSKWNARLTSPLALILPPFFGSPSLVMQSEDPSVTDRAQLTKMFDLSNWTNCCRPLVRSVGSFCVMALALPLRWTIRWLLCDGRFRQLSVECWWWDRPMTIPKKISLIFFSPAGKWYQFRKTMAKLASIDACCVPLPPATYRCVKVFPRAPELCQVNSQLYSYSNCTEARKFPNQLFKFLQKKVQTGKREKMLFPA